MKRVFFCAILLCEKARLVLRLPRNNREKCFSVTMASPFEIVDEEYIEELKDKSENENTTNSAEW